METFYVVVDPQHLTPTPWLPDDDRSWAQSWVVPDGEILAAFLRHYKGDYELKQRNEFYERGRKYYEVPVDIVAEAGGLEDVAEVLFDAWELLNEGIRFDPNTVIKRCLILSWREE